MWPYPWPNDPDTQTWPRYGQDVPAYQKWSFYVKGFKSYSYSLHRQTDRQTHRHDQKHYLPAYAGGKKCGAFSSLTVHVGEFYPRLSSRERQINAKGSDVQNQRHSLKYCPTNRFHHIQMPSFCLCSTFAIHHLLYAYIWQVNLPDCWTGRCKIKH